MTSEAALLYTLNKKTVRYSWYRPNIPTNLSKQWWCSGHSLWLSSCSARFDSWHWQWNSIKIAKNSLFNWGHSKMLHMSKLKSKSMAFLSSDLRKMGFFWALISEKWSLYDLKIYWSGTVQPLKIISLFLVLHFLFLNKEKAMISLSFESEWNINLID